MMNVKMRKYFLLRRKKPSANIGSQFCNFYSDGHYFCQANWLKNDRQDGSRVQRRPINRKAAKNYTLLDLTDCGSENEESESNPKRRHRLDDRRRLQCASAAMVKDLMTNPFPGFAMLYRARGYRSRIILSRSMAQEMIWHLLHEGYWDKAQRYFKLKRTARRALISELFERFGNSFWGISKKFIEGQVHLVHSLIFRRRRKFEEALRDRFTRHFFSSVVKEIISTSDRSAAGRSNSLLLRRFDDFAYSALDAWLSATGHVFGQWPNLDKSVLPEALLPPRFFRNLLGRFLSSGGRCLRYYVVRYSDLQSQQEDASTGAENTNILSRNSSEQIFYLASNPNSTQVIFDRTTEKIVVSSSMCYELCWLYLPTVRLSFLRHCKKELARAMHSHLSQHYVGMKLVDVEAGLNFLLDYVESERSRGLSTLDILSDARREEIFEAKSRRYRLMKQCTADLPEVCRLLLGDGNPSADDLSFAISELLCKQLWTLGDTVKTCPTTILEWRNRLLSRDWISIVHSLTRSQKRLSFPRGFEQMCLQNLRRLMVELVRFSHNGVSRDMVEAIDEGLQAILRTRQLEEAQRMFQIAKWYMVSNGREREAAQYLTSGLTFPGIRPQEIQTMESIKPIFEGLLLFYEASRHGINFMDDSSSSDIAKMLRLMKANVLAHNNATGVLACVVHLLQHLGENSEAAAFLEEYMNLHPDDLSVYELAVEKLPADHAAVFAAKLIQMAPWHPLVVDWCQYKISQQSHPDDASAIAVRLMQFLDYGKNKDRADAWALLAVMLSMAQSEGDKMTIAEAWKERASWWRIFHLKKGKTANESLNILKKNVLQKLEDVTPDG